jgi:iron complex outermembrane receptor protein
VADHPRRGLLPGDPDRLKNTNRPKNTNRIKHNHRPWNSQHAHTTTLRLVADIAVGLGLTGWVSTCLGATAPQFEFHIQAGRLTEQLVEVGDITQTQILFDDDRRIEKIRTQGVQGWRTTEEALASLLRGTGFVCVRVRHAISVRASSARQPPDRCLDADSGPHTQDKDSASPTTDLAEVHVYSDKPASHLEEGHQIGAVLITIDAQAIRESGALDASNLLQITQNFSGGPTQDTHIGAPEAIANSGLGTGANLRGASSRATFVVLNGMPVAFSGSAASFFDWLQFPLAATERVEILPDGASAIYGSEAIAGVMNIHTVDHYDHWETHLELGSVTRGHQEVHRLSQVLGTRWDGGDIVVIGEVVHRGDLPTASRWQSNADLSPVGLNGYVLANNPGNLQTSTGIFYPIPSGQSGRPLDFSTLSPGTPNLANPWTGSDIVPDQTRWALYTSMHHAFNPSLSIWTTILGTQRYAVASWGGQLIGDLDVTHSPLLLHAPAGTTITEDYNLLDDLGPRLSSVSVRTLNAQVGLQVTLSGTWKLVFRGSAAREWESQLTTGQAEINLLQTAVDNGVFDPFGAGANNSRAAIASVEMPQSYDSLSELGFYQILIGGQHFSVGAGPWSEVFGAEFHDQGFRSATSDPVVSNDLRRQTSAAFAEIEAPLLDDERLPTPLRNLTVSLAGRYERYSDFGHSAVPRFGFELAPLEHIKLRGTWGWSVRAPNLGDLSDKYNTSDPYLLNHTPILILGGGNPNLNVEQARTRTFGAEFTWENLMLDVGHWELDYQNRIDQPTLEPNILTNPQYASFVTNHPAAAQLEAACAHSSFSQGTRQDCLQQQIDAIVDLRLHNMSTLRTDGIDAHAKASWETTHYGKFGVDVAATYVLEYQLAQTPQAPFVSLLNQESEPLAFQLISAERWEWGPATVILTERHANHYRDTETYPVTRVSAWNTMDARVSYTFGWKERARSPVTEIAAFCENVFNRLPPYSANITEDRGYDPENGDLTGRMCTASVEVKW